ncbi:MAG: hypothetical protein WAW96_08150 [Alphaproteobacteria bacterium]
MMWEPIETLANAQAAVSQKLVRHWPGFLRASVVPAAAAVAALIWMAEAYWACAGFTAGQIAAMVSTGAAIFYLSTLAVGRLVRIGLGVERPRKVRALASTRPDTRILVVCFGLLALVAAGVLLEVLTARAVITSYFVAGSEVIARPVLAVAQVAILLGLYYLLGRLSLFLPAQVTAPGAEPAVIWRATEGHGAILFIVVVAVPVAVLSLLAGPMLWWVGALPWPGLDDFARTQTLGLRLGTRLYLVVPVLFLSLLAFWSLIAAGLCAAWDALKERGVLQGLEPRLEATKAAASAE